MRKLYLFTGISLVALTVVITGCAYYLLQKKSVSDASVAGGKFNFTSAQITPASIKYGGDITVRLNATNGLADTIMIDPTNAAFFCNVTVMGAESYVSSTFIDSYARPTAGIKKLQAQDGGFKVTLGTPGIFLVSGNGTFSVLATFKATTDASLTKITLVDAVCFFWNVINGGYVQFDLTKQVSVPLNDGTTTPAPTQIAKPTAKPTTKPGTTAAPTPTPETPKAQIPSTLTDDGWTVGDTSGNGFYIEKKGVAKILFTEKVDLSDENLNKLKELDKYVTITPGYVKIDVENLPFLNKNTLVTFYSIDSTFISADYVEKNNLAASSDDVSEVNYNSTTKEVTFKTTGFNDSYSVVPRLDVLNENGSVKEKAFKLDGKVVDTKATITVYLNGTALEVSPQINSDGTFSIDLELSPGQNNIRVTAKSISGVESTEQIQINFVSDMTMVITIVLIIAAIGLVSVITFFVIKRRRELKQKAI